MRYLMMIYQNENAPQTSPVEQEAELASYAAFGHEVHERNVLLGDERVQPSSTAMTVRIRDGKIQNSSGPVSNTVEQLGGFYLLQCRDLDEALEIAAKNPGARTGTIEIRPIYEQRL